VRSSISTILAVAALGNWNVASSAQDTPVPHDPYPIAAAGWGPEAGHGLYYSRWVEDWSGLRAAGVAPLLKFLPVGGGVSLTMSTETRLRYESWNNGQLIAGNDDHQGLLRNILGADLRLHSGLRIYGEVGSAYVSRHRAAATASFENRNSLQQLFADARLRFGTALAGVMAGRQEFADGPRQLLGLGDGPNLHRSWNGVRLYAHGERVRAGAFDLRATQLERGSFDEKVDHGERLQGVNASMVVARDAKGHDIYLEPFWIHTTVKSADDRHSYGARIWGQRGAAKFDATIVRQTGERAGRDIEAWGFFAVQSLAVGSAGWKPRLTLHVDVASGGSAGSSKDSSFNPLYSSSSYLGEGRFLGLSNLLLIAPGLSISPGRSTNLSVEHGFARRLSHGDAAYAGGVRAYAGTATASGHTIGELFRMQGSLNGKLGKDTHVAVAMGYEHFSAGHVLARAKLRSGSHVHASTTFRF
jgi:hypothetical protein